MKRPVSVVSLATASRACRALCGLLVLGALAGCETAPVSGQETLAQVIEQPRARDGLWGAHRHLHAALRAGATRADAERARLVRGECGDRDAAATGGVRWRVLTTVLPPGVPSAPGTLVDLADVPAGPRTHGRFVAVAPPLGQGETLRSAFGGRLHTPCQLEGLPPGRQRMQITGTVAPWEIDFAVPERVRHGRVSDAELAAGRVVLLSCQLKVADGGDWSRPVWIARVPEGLVLRVGDVVRLVAGAAEASRDTGPEPRLLGRADGVTAPGGNAVVRCH